MTAPAPTVCPDCKGERVFRVGRLWWYCIGCSCDRCGKPTSTPPMCAECQREQDDRDAANAYREGRYE